MAEMIDMTSVAWMAAKELIETQRLRLQLQEQFIAELEHQKIDKDILLDTANHLAEHLYAHIAELEHKYESEGTHGDS
jgi:signal recognition particle GTPase